MSGNSTPSPPKSPVLHSAEMMEITPYSSNGSDDPVFYSDSDIGLPQHYANYNSSASETDSTLRSSPEPRRKKKIASGSGSLSPRSTSSHRRDSLESTPSPRPKKSLRRRSRSLEAGLDRSSRSAKYDMPISGGYTLTPATGKIFRNLLILEESLRQQVIQQRALRRKYLTFLAVLCCLIATISHHLYFNNEIPPSGPFRVILQFSLMALVITVLLYHLSGEYQKTIVLPRKFLSSTNKGLRQLNVRLVKIKTPLSDTVIDLIREVSLMFATMCIISLHKVYPSLKQNPNSKLEVFFVGCQLRCQPRTGVTDVKLVLNARTFNTDVREGWELYRSEFWIHEGVRRRNAMMNFANQYKDLDKDTLLKKDKRERKDRRKSMLGDRKNYEQTDETRKNLQVPT